MSKVLSLTVMCVTFLLIRKKSCILHHATFCPSSWWNTASHLMSCSYHWRASRHSVSLLCPSWTGNVHAGCTRRVDKLQSVRFSQWHCCRSESSGLWHCVIKQVVTAVSKDLRVFVVICFSVKMKALWSFEMPRTSHLMRRHHISEDLNILK